MEEPQVSTQCDYGDGYLAIDFDDRLVTVAGAEVRLQPKEFDLLRTLVTNLGKAITRGQLLTDVWGPEYRNDDSILDKGVSRLRASIERDHHNPQYIETVHRVGYRFNAYPCHPPWP